MILARLAAIALIGLSVAVGSIAIATASPGKPATSPIYGITVPVGYREWMMVAPAEEAAPLDALRLVLGNLVAVKAYRSAPQPFPDGTVLAKLAWKRRPSSAFPSATVPGAATTVQFVVKDSRKYAATGG